MQLMKQRTMDASDRRPHRVRFPPDAACIAGLSTALYCWLQSMPVSNTRKIGCSMTACVVHIVTKQAVMASDKKYLALWNVNIIFF